MPVPTYAECIMKSVEKSSVIVPFLPSCFLRDLFSVAGQLRE
jgi:hypothetical protein